jgi:transposase-like protein
LQTSDPTSEKDRINVHHNARLTAHSRAALVRRVLDQGQPRKVVATAFGVDLKTVGKWVRGFQAEGVALT